MGDGTTVAEVINEQIVSDDTPPGALVESSQVEQAIHETNERVSVTIDSTPLIIDGEEAENIALTVLSQEQVTLATDVQEILLNTEVNEMLLKTETANVVVEDVGAGAAFGTPIHELWVQDTQPPANAYTPYLWIQTGLGPGGEDWTMWFEDGV